MGLPRSIVVCVLWGCFSLFNFSCECSYETEGPTTKALQDEIAEPRRHRLQLLFPLLLRISTRLAALVPTALMGLAGIILFVVFSKKALIISLFALLLTLADKYKAKDDEIYIHKVNPYAEYNGEEHIHYHHAELPKYYYGGGRPPQIKRKYFKRMSSPDSQYEFSKFNFFKPLPVN